MRTFSIGFLCLVLGVVVTGCGSDDGGGGSASCNAASACGGNIVGTWHISNVCLPPVDVPPPDTCPSGKISVPNPTATGTITFADDGTMTTAVTTTFKESVSFPVSCYNEAQCTQFAAVAQQQDGVTGATCAFNATSGCSCSLTLSSDDTSSGTYTVSGSNITTSSAGSPDDNGTYCVSGSTLSVRQTDADGTTTIIATK